MDMSEILKIDNDLDRNEELYKVFDEDKRLKSRTGLVEKITTLTEIEKLISSDSKILDVGAGTGAYTLPLGQKACEIVALEPSSSNFKLLESKSKALANIKVYNKSSYDLKDLESDYFDIVLLFGPMYHLSRKEDRMDVLRQAKRVCKDDGYILISFINHDTVLISETINYNTNIFSSDSYISEKQRLIDRPFVFFKLKEAKEMIEKSGLTIKEIVSSDGFSEILSQKLEEMTEKSFNNYLAFHLNNCKNPETLGASNHLLFVCENKK
ncbi:bifunctional 3-demethylubiquinone-9 3-methyltransferase/ 2-octaprenyl-6-hydroxy phenol methylase [Anaerococcus prevotii]|uniref:Methyltransferase type 11 n=2 Tax=Anaerococcus prevotii TaxID=33034 RepID=C7RFQ1_ANAPD|nr:Methyltransferase type 11 [Anaerococcus prevotii DSM 20548]SUU93866.1 bifunctional 3-demethylubiquinone-9 3-methyltransferase/ 2-octaprenyl-6-hydroxy phenol methylase [Anaerococcus prevotii]